MLLHASMRRRVDLLGFVVVEKNFLQEADLWCEVIDRQPNIQMNTTNVLLDFSLVKIKRSFHGRFVRLSLALLLELIATFPKLGRTRCRVSTQLSSTQPFDVRVSHGLRFVDWFLRSSQYILSTRKQRGYNMPTSLKCSGGY